MKLSTLFLVLVIFCCSCGQSQQSDSAATETARHGAEGANTQSTDSARPSQNTDTINNLKIYVDKLGNITADGQPSSLDDLNNRLKTLKTKNGMIYYSRDNIAGDPHPQAMQVMELVANYEIPVKFYTDNTFMQPIK